MSRLITGNSKITFSEEIKNYGAISVCLACFFTPLSTSLMGIFSGLAVLVWLLSGGFLSLPKTLSSYPATIIALSLFLLMCIAISYSPATTIEALNTLKKYRELLLLPVIISILSASKSYRLMAENSFVTGCIMLMLISYGMALEIIPEARYGHSVVFHITHSFFMAVLAFWALHQTADSRQYRYFWLFIYLTAVVNIFYIAPGRTGMFIFICLMCLFLVQRCALVKCFIGFAVLSSLIFTIYFTSENFSVRVQEVINEIGSYEPGKSRTSIGQRFDWWFTSVTLIKEKPLLGHGTGSFPIVHERATKSTSIKETDNPHNEYLFITVQFGFVGLALFLGIFLFQLITCRTLSDRNRMLLQGVILAMLSGSLMNSLLFDSQQGHFYLFMSAALMASQSKKSNIVL